MKTELDLNFYMTLISLGTSIFSLWISLMVAKRFFKPKITLVKPELQRANDRRGSTNKKHNKPNQKNKKNPSDKRNDKPTPNVGSQNGDVSGEETPQLLF